MTVCNNCASTRKNREVDQFGVCDACRSHPLGDCRKPIPVKNQYNPWPYRNKWLAMKYFGSTDVSLIK